MASPDRTRLLHGPYTPPALNRGDRAFCLYRDTDVVITAWSGGRIPWPRCQAPRQRGGSGLLVDEELRRAVRCESETALMHWFGVSRRSTWRWRQAFGVGRADTEGSARIIRAAGERGAAKLRGKKLSREQVEQRRRVNAERELWRNVQPCPRPNGSHPWTEGELALLGTGPDEAVAAMTGRTTEAVRTKRVRRRVRKYKALG